LEAPKENYPSIQSKNAGRRFEREEKKEVPEALRRKENIMAPGKRGTLLLREKRSLPKRGGSKNLEKKKRATKLSSRKKKEF